jgi:hypothetical protein
VCEPKIWVIFGDFQSILMRKVCEPKIWLLSVHFTAEYDTFMWLLSVMPAGEPVQ